MAFHILFEPEAIQDVQEGIDWYESVQEGLGVSFYEELNKSIDYLRENPYFRIRYDQVRCLPLKKFPFMIHFTVDEKNNSVVIRAVFNTFLSPERWKDR